MTSLTRTDLDISDLFGYGLSMEPKKQFFSIYILGRVRQATVWSFQRDIDYVLIGEITKKMNTEDQTIQIGELGSALKKALKYEA